MNLNLTHRVFHAPCGVMLIDILRDGYLRPHKLDSICTDAAPYHQLHLDWRLLLANNFEFRRERGSVVFDPRGPVGNTDAIQFRGAELTEPALYEMLRQYNKRVRRPYMIPPTLTEITVTRQIDLRKYLRGMAVNDKSEISSIVAMYPNIHFYVAQKCEVHRNARDV
jgi:hypothetical protein